MGLFPCFDIFSAAVALRFFLLLVLEGIFLAFVVEVFSFSKTLFLDLSKGLTLDPVSFEHLGITLLSRDVIHSIALFILSALSIF